MYNVGIIGLGQIAYSIDNDPARKITWSHINAYKKSKNTQVSSICDIDETQVKKISQECDIYSGYTDYREMLKNEDLDIVSICTPINTHVQIIKDCIKHNVKAIFCEKTISYSLDDSSEIVELCKKNNVVLAVNHVRRWDDFNQKIKNIITQDNYGDIYT
ncbi:Gfo/Idh/MocA family oxidoreductase, partial [Escherichia coli]|nr:Gfo/Idh/MocA family oxidoreductase [Escherichia coli]